MEFFVNLAYYTCGDIKEFNVCGDIKWFNVISNLVTNITIKLTQSSSPFYPQALLNLSLICLPNPNFL